MQDKALAELQKQSGRNLLGHGANNKRTTKVAVPKMFTPKNKGRLGGSGRRSSLDQLGIATFFGSSNGRESPEPVAKQYGKNEMKPTPSSTPSPSILIPNPNPPTTPQAAKGECP